MIFFDDWHRLLLVITLSLPRLAAAFAVIPILGRQIVPGMVRNGITLSFALILYPMVEAAAPRPEIDALVLFGLILKEVFLGFVIGTVIAAPLWAVETAGYLIDNQRGAAMAESINPLSGEQSSPLGLLFLQFMVTLIFVSGLFLTLLGTLYHSYQVWPIFTFYPDLSDLSGAGPVFFLQTLDLVMRLAVVLSAPVVIAMFLSELGLAMVSRFAPQLQVFFLAMPVKSAVGILVLVLYLPFLQFTVLEDFGRLDEVFASLEALMR